MTKEPETMLEIVIYIIRFFRILLTSIAMMVLSTLFFVSAVINSNIEHLALALILNALSMYEINEDNKRNKD